MRHIKAIYTTAAYLLLATTIFLLAGCRQKGEAGKADSTAISSENTLSESEMTDSVFPQQSDTPPMVPPTIAPSDSGMETQMDTAPKTARKRQKVTFRPEQLIGEWMSGTMHEVYLADGTGRTWDTEDDVSAEESRTFSWTLSENCLLTIYRMELGGVVPNVSHVVACDSLHLVRKDDFGNRILFDRVR